MAIKYFKPTTQSRRKMSVTDYSWLSKKRPDKKLTTILKKHSGRDRFGHISVRHQGGREKRLYRAVESLNKKFGLSAKVKGIEYDPNRTCFVAIVEFSNGEKQYILAPEGIKVDDEVVAQDKAEIKNGNRLKLKNIPMGTQIYDIELIPGRGRGQIARSAGSSAAVAAQAEGNGRHGNYVQVKLPSSEIRLIHGECFASIGQLSNTDHKDVRYAKAGRMRHKGIRPTVRGKAMHPGAHPHGGGEGVNPIGLRYSKTPWGKPARGNRTRRNKYSNKFIVKRRK